ncbi:purine-cytosine permease family protein [Azospirillum thermophilum]|uniref:purine-cytosine permease family protein n=1 Tax=Azospirillum thermophilum TaxID=2202148 RepID=UPI001FE6B7F1|nr:hypothetical protein [Azospirillum thermophilum]
MGARQRIVRERRQYNQLAADQTLEDYALRYTAERARRWSAWRVVHTALGAISFLACEAIGAAVTLAYGFENAIAAILAVGVLNILVGLPITYHAAKAGVDIDLLARGAGFGYLGSTVTSLVYASFTFILFSIEASIMSAGLTLVLGIPDSLAHVISALGVIPIAVYGIRVISRMQVATQPVWILLQCVPLAYFVLLDRSVFAEWTGFPGLQGTGGFALLPFGMAASMLLSLLPQIGEQVDYLRFLPSPARMGRGRWWAAMLAGGPGWSVIGSLKLALGSLLAFLALKHGLPPADAMQPTVMYHMAFSDLFGWPALALALTGIFVVVCQMKINVTNAYAGSIAWSNFFSRLTRSHPGRVVWLVFNGLLALLLMEIGILGVIESILALYANVAVAGWGRWRPTSPSTSRWASARGDRVQARPPLRHQPGRRRGDGAVGAVLHRRLLRAGGAGAAGAGALHRAGGGHRRRPGHRLGDAGALLPRPPGRRPAGGGGGDPLLDLREQLRAGGHGLLPGLRRADLLALLHAGGALPRPVQDEEPLRRPDRRGAARRAAAAAGGGGAHAHRPFHRGDGAVHPAAGRGADRHRLPLRQRSTGGADGDPRRADRGVLLPADPVGGRRLAAGAGA